MIRRMQAKSREAGESGVAKIIREIWESW